MLRVKAHRYMYRRGGQLIFRRAVPERARFAFGGRVEIQVSLDTSNVAEARHLLSRELAKFEKILSAASGTRCPAAVLSPVVREPGLEEIEEGVRQWFAERVERLVREADAATHEPKAAALLRGYAALSRNVADGVRIGGETALMTDWIVEALTKRFGWHISAGNPLHRRLEKLVSRGQIAASRRFQQEIEGEPILLSDDIFSPEQYRLDVERQRERRLLTPASILDLFDGYVLERKPASATIKAWRRQVSAFISFIGHDDAAKVTPEDVIAWKEHLLQKAGKDGTGLSAKTVG